MDDGTPTLVLAPIEPLVQLSEEACSGFRARLVATGYGPALLGEAESIAPAQLDAIRLPLVQRWLRRKAGAGSRLALLFEYLSPLSRREAEDALTAPLLSALEGAGVVREHGGEIASAVRVTPLEGLFIVSDPYRSGADAAMGPGLTTLDLVRLLPAAPRSLLDVGTGAGTLALIAAARGAPRALGIDVNERAIALARFNARLNGLVAEFRTGDLFEPTEGEKFDLVLSQPPYVVQPDGVERVTYLHGGPRGDELAFRFVAAFPAALAPRGRGLLLFDSPPPSAPLQARLRSSLGDAAVDLVLLLAPGPSADLQAVGYASVEDPALGDRYRAALGRYRDHLERFGTEAFSRVLVILQASEGGRLDAQLPVGGLGQLDAQRLDRLLAGLALAGADEARLLATRVALAPGGRLVEERAAGHLAGEPLRAVRFDKGALALDREISEAGSVLFALLESAATVRQATARFAEASGADEIAIRRTVLDFVREGLSRALLVSVDAT